MDVRLHHSAIGAQFAPARDLLGPRQFDHTVEQDVERLGLDLIGPADERGVIRGLGQIQAAKLAQDETIVDVVLGLFITPLIQMLDREHAQDDLDRGGAAAFPRRLRAAPDQVGLDLLKEDIVVQQCVQGGQFWLQFQLQLRHQLEEVHRIIPIDYHSAEPPRELGVAVNYRLPHRGSCIFRTKN